MKLTQVSIREKWNTIKFEETGDSSWKLENSKLIKVKGDKEKIIIDSDIKDNIFLIDAFNTIKDFHMNKKGEWFIEYAGKLESIFLTGKNTSDNINAFYYSTFENENDDKFGFAKRLTIKDNEIVDSLKNIRDLEKKDMYKKLNKIFDPNQTEKLVKLFPFLGKMKGVINFDSVTLELQKKVGKITDPSYINKLMDTLEAIWFGTFNIEEKRVDKIEKTSTNNAEEPVEEIEEGTEYIEEPKNEMVIDTKNWTPMNEQEEKEDIDLNDVDLSKF